MLALFSERNELLIFYSSILYAVYAQYEKAYAVFLSTGQAPSQYEFDQFYAEGK